MVSLVLALSLVAGGGLACTLHQGNATSPAAISPPTLTAPPEITTTIPGTGITAIYNATYALVASGPLLLDLYLPGTASGPMPLIIWIHGGGWEGGSKENPLPLRLGFAGKGYAIAAINYRLSSEAAFPAQIEDCKAAVRWLRANAAKYNLDPARFAAWGSSAGGHLAALLGTSGGVTELEGSVGGNLEYVSSVQAVCDYFGPADLTRFTTATYHAPAAAELVVSELLGVPVAQNLDIARAASPVTYVSAGDPPFFIVHGTDDNTVPLSQSQMLYDALIQAGVPATLNVIEGAAHGGDEFSSAAIVAQIALFLESSLK